MNMQKFIIFFVIIIFTKAISELDYDNCVFVPYWQCKEDNSGLIPNEDGTPIDYRSHDQIDIHDVCCKNECGRRKVGKYINNQLWSDGKALLGEFPWMLELLHNGMYRCGASLIHPKVALTAAHCVSQGGSYRVRAGVWNRNPTNEQTAHQIRYAKKRIIHPDFKERSNFLWTIHPDFREVYLLNDIALLILNSPFDMNENVGLICLNNKITVADYSKCIVTGWGESGGKYEEILKKIDLAVVDNNLCAKLWVQVTRKTFKLHPSSICASGLNGASCKGDGGSPLVCMITGEINRYEQVGIVSWGMWFPGAPCGGTEAPGIYTNVFYFRNWIKNVLSENNLSI